MFLCYFNTSAQLLFLIFQFWYKTCSLFLVTVHHSIFLFLFYQPILPSIHPFFLNLSFHPLFILCLFLQLNHQHHSSLLSPIHLSFHPFLFPFFHKPNHPSIHPPSLLLSLFLSFLLLIIIFPLFIFCSFLPSFHNPNPYESFHSFILPFFLHLSIHLSFLPSTSPTTFPSFHHPSIHPSLSFFPLPIFLSFLPSFHKPNHPHPFILHPFSLPSSILPYIIFLPSIHPSIFSPHPSFIPS